MKKLMLAEIDRKDVVAGELYFCRTTDGDFDFLIARGEFADRWWVSDRSNIEDSRVLTVFEAPSNSKIVG